MPAGAPAPETAGVARPAPAAPVAPPGAAAAQGASPGAEPAAAQGGCVTTFALLQSTPEFSRLTFLLKSSGLWVSAPRASCS